MPVLAPISPAARSPALALPALGPGLGLGYWVPPPERPVGLTVRYVRKTGSDSNGGTSPSDAWLTINKALTTVAAGTIIYVGAGTYREVVSVTNSGTPSAPIYLQGDVDGGFTGDQGMVCLTAYLTNDTTAPSATALITATSKNDLVFQNILFINGTGAILNLSNGLRHTFRDCGFFSSTNQVIIFGTVATGQPANRLFDRCVFASMPGDAGALQPLFSVGLGVGAGGQDIDHNIIFANSIFYCSNAVTINIGGQASAPRGGGLKIINNTFIGGVRCADNTGSNSSTIYKVLFLGNLIFLGANAGSPSTSILSSNGNSASMFEDYNVILGTGGIQNWTQGGHTSQGTRAPMFHMFNVERIWGGAYRPFGEPFPSSSIDRRGSLIPNQNGVAALMAAIGKGDLRNVIRPLPPSLWMPGPLQRGMNFAKETGTVFSGTAAISLTGPGFQDFQLPLDSTSSATLTIYVRYDSSYTGPMPSFQVLPNENMGVGSASVDAPPGQAGVWNQLTVILNPTAKGICTVRVVSNDTSGVGKAIFDAFNVV